jgi:hypothetical protein
MNNKFGNEYIQITKNLYLTEYSFISLDDTLKNKPQRDPVNHIFLYDRSGSMYGLLGRLIEDLIIRVKKIPLGDTITFGWFSGEGQKNFVIKGFKVTVEHDYALLENLLRANNTTIGCTCFSEILKDTKQVIEDLSVFSSSFSLCFFTDGYPVVSDYKREIQEINAAIEQLNNKVTASLLIGYGDYYNKQLMADMAEKIGGSLTHSANLTSFSVSLENFLETAQESKKIVVKIKNEVTPETIIFNINGNNINLYSVNKCNEVSITCNDNEKVSLYVLTTIKPKGISASKDKKSFEKALYAAAYIQTQKTKTDLAIDILGSLGDKKLVDMVTNSYTNAEYGIAEENIKHAVVDPSKRYLEGKVSNYVPPKDAFCLLDLLDVLAEDDKAYFYPRHEAFVYKRIGKQAVQDEKFPKFNADTESKSSFRDVVWNETKLNLSLRTIINGTIKLPEEADKYGLAKKYPTYQFKNYTFVKDGILNVTKVPATISESTFNVLVKKGVIESLDKYQPDNKYLIKLDAIPVVNRKIAEGKTSAIELCKSVIQEQKLKATLKSLKYFKDRDFPEKEITAETAKTFIEKQQAFLESVGINTKTGAYEPTMMDSESTDFYMAKEFAIKIKGLSSLPKIEVVTAKLKDNKKLTTSDALVSAGIYMYQNEVKPTLDWFTNKINELNTELKKVRRQIQETKFAVLLGKRWFDEFASREENTLVVDGFEITISLTEKKVAV